MLLSIVVNAWPGTDKFRFRLQLETFMYDTSNNINYLNLCKELLEGWEKNKFSIPEDNFKSAFEKHQFHKVDFNHDDVEVILAIDTTDGSEIEDIFKSWCNDYDINNQILRAKLGVAGMRNVAMQEYNGEFIIFRDDDDFSASIAKLLKQCKSLPPMGHNDAVPQPFQYNNITELYDYMQKVQQKPTIAILMDGLKLKNTWGSIDNPFSATPTPVDTSTIELVDRPAFTSMCSKIFTREAIDLIYNSTCCGALEDARSHYLQQLPQHCIWLFTEKKLRWLKEQWMQFKKTKKVNAGVKWLNMNVVTYKEWQIGSNESIARVDKFFAHNFYVSKCSPNFIYVLASGSYSSVSWSYGSIVGVLEAFRNSNRTLDFTIGDLKKLKSIITSAVKTTLVNTNNVSTVEWISEKCKDKGNKLCKLLEEIANYKYIFWFAIVHDNSWKKFETSMKKIKDLITDIDVEKVNGSDVVKDNIAHPNSVVKVNVNGIDKDLSLCNCIKIRDVTDETNYTERFENRKPLIVGGGNRSILLPLLLLILFIVLVIYFIVRQHGCEREEGTIYKQSIIII